MPCRYEHVSSRECTGIPNGPPPTTAPTPSPTACDQTLIEVDVQTDEYPGETEWRLKNLCNGEMVRTSLPFTGQNKLYSNTYCLPAAEFEFTITDSYGDGKPIG